MADIDDLVLQNTFGEWVDLMNETTNVVNAQIIGDILSGLQTTAKDTLVNAINELHAEVAGKLATSLKATTSMAQAGTNDTNYMTPAKTKELVETFAATTTQDITIEHFSGDGTQKNFVLSGQPGNAKDVFVYVDGIFQNRDTWTLNSDTVSFTYAPWVDSDIEIDWGKAVPLTSVPSDSVGSAELKDNSVEPVHLTSDSISRGFFRNKLINGNFDFWQRGTTFTGFSDGSGQYTADRWAIRADLRSGSLSNDLVERRAFGIGQTAVPGSPRYFVRVQGQISGQSDTSENFGIEQRIENVDTSAGEEVTVSFWVKAESARSVGLSYIQNFGTGGSPSSEVVGSIGTVSLTTSWQKFELTFNMPSVSGKTIGSDGNDFVAILLNLQAGAGNSGMVSVTGSSNFVDIASIQLEEGGKASGFEKRPLGLELSLCERYYQKSYDLETDPGSSSPSPGSQIQFEETSVSTTLNNPGLVNFSTRMRDTPTSTIYSPNTGASGNVRLLSGTPQDLSVLSNFPSNTGLGSIHLNSVSPRSSTPSVYALHYTVDAEL